MASNINPTYPAEGESPTAQERANFSAAKTEIEALQTNDAAQDTAIAGKEPANANIQGHIALIAGQNPHGTDKAGVGLGNVDNTSDANKPVSTATQTALDGKTNKVGVSVANNFVAFVDTGGTNLKDSGSNAGSFDSSGAADDVQADLDAHKNANNFHMTTDQNAAMDAANLPTGLNPIATIDDISGATNAHIIQDEGVDVSQEIRLDFVGAGVTAASAAGVTTVTIPGGSAGAGDVVGPEGAIDNRIATFNGITGKLIQDGGSTIANLEPADATIIKQADVDNIPIDGATTVPVSSNWAFDHVAAADPHPGYLTPAEGNAAYLGIGAQAVDSAALGGLAASAYLQNITGEPLSDLSDVTITTPANNQVLTYQAGVWVNQAASGGGNVSTPDAAAEGSVNVSNIVGLTQVEYNASIKNANTLYLITG